MKRFLPVLLLAGLLFCANSLLHAGDVLSRRMDVTFHQTPLREAMNELSNRGNFLWSYNSSIIDAQKNVTLIANDWTLREILHELLGEKYQFKANGNYIIIKRSPKKTEQLSGYIKDPATGQRIANATVYDRKTLRATTTDSSGYYELKIGKQAEVVVAKLHYADTVLQVSPQTPRYQKLDLQVDTRTTSPQKISLENEVERVASQLDDLFRESWEKWHQTNIQDSLHRNFQVSLLPRIGTNHTLSSQVYNNYSFNILAGVSLGNRKLEVGGLANISRQDLSGVQIAGIANNAGGTVNGIQIGGISNRAGTTLRGMQIGGIGNIARRSEAPAAQVAGIVNAAGKGEVHLQVAGIINTAETAEFQAAGLVNSADTIQGVQVSGLVNRARKVSGVQIGLFNSAKEVHGLQIGLLNRSGRRVMPLINW